MNLTFLAFVGGLVNNQPINHSGQFIHKAVTCQQQVAEGLPATRNRIPLPQKVHTEEKTNSTRITSEGDIIVHETGQRGPSEPLNYAVNTPQVCCTPYALRYTRASYSTVSSGLCECNEHNPL